MKIYAIKDRMIDYFMTPFAAPNDNEVMASLSNEINREGNLNAIAAAPHHFEIHCLGEVDDSGNLHAKREFVCDCSNLVRPRRESTERGTKKDAQVDVEIGNLAARNGGYRVASDAGSEAVPKSSGG